MLIEEINEMLDRQGILSFYDDSKIEHFLEDNGITALIRLRVTKEGGYAIFNFENDGFDEKEIKEQLKEFNPKITKDAVSIRVDSPSPAVLEGFRTLNKVPSVVMDAVVFSEGYYYVYFRFHSADESRLTTALRGKLIGFDRFAIRYLGRSPGLYETFSEISSIIPLNYVEINGSVPPSFMRVFDDPVLMNLGVSWTREMKYLLEDEVRAVYYDKHSLLRDKEDWINEISKGSRIYETSFTNPMIQYFVSTTSESGIVTMGMPQKLYGKTFSIATVVPAMVMPEFFKVVYALVREFENWEMDIHIVDSFNSMPHE